MARAMGWAAAVGAACALSCGEARRVEDVSAGQLGVCASCHSAPGEAPPFRDPNGATNPSLASVGAHDAHLHPDVAAPIACSTCHTVPRTVSDPGHLEPSPTDLRFSGVATARGAAPTYDPQTRTCAAAYCHGAFPGGNGGASPAWVGGSLASPCTSCHGFPPQTGAHQAHVGKTFGNVAISCETCHGAPQAGSAVPVLLPANHVNGTVDVTLPAWSAQTRSCAQACHGPRSWSASGGG